MVLSVLWLFFCSIEDNRCVQSCEGCGSEGGPTGGALARPSRAPNGGLCCCMYGRSSGNPLCVLGPAVVCFDIPTVTSGYTFVGLCSGVLWVRVKAGSVPGRRACGLSCCWCCDIRLPARAKNEQKRKLFVGPVGRVPRRQGRFLAHRASGHQGHSGTVASVTQGVGGSSGALKSRKGSIS